MTEKVFGFYEKDAYRTKQTTVKGLINFYHIQPDKIVPVVLKSEYDKLKINCDMWKWCHIHNKMPSDWLRDGLKLIKKRNLND